MKTDKTKKVIVNKEMEIFRNANCVPHLERLEIVEKKVDVVVTLLNTVSANGRRGLENSLKDIHEEVKGLKESVDSLIKLNTSGFAFNNLKQSAKEYFKVAGWLQMFKNKLISAITLLFFILIINSILHPLGVDLKIQTIWEHLRTWAATPR